MHSPSVSRDLGEMEMKEEGETCDGRYLIVHANKCGMLDLVRFFWSGWNAQRFLEGSGDECSSWGSITSRDHRWVIVVSVILGKIIATFRKPMEWTRILVEFVLNLLYQNGGIAGLVSNGLTGSIVVPRRGSDTFISVIGHLDYRVDLYKGEYPYSFGETNKPLLIGNAALMDLCMMASKLAYENANVVKNIVNHNWKARLSPSLILQDQMHFVEFYNCWNDYQKERSTQVFILCDKPTDASLILISFRGTEPFDADDWITDVDYSWYEIPKLGKVHMGFLEALGLGNRAQTSTFKAHLLTKRNYGHSNIEEEGMSVETDKLCAYYAVNNKLKSLFSEHKNAKFIVTGHSLGAALAILFPAVLLLHKEEDLMNKLLGVYTFGQPRVGDEQLHKFMEARICYPVSKYIRMVYSYDLVPRLPYDNKEFLYKHFGMCLYYNSFYVSKNMNEEPNPNYFGWGYLFPEYLNAVWELIRSMAMGFLYGKEYKEGWFSVSFRFFGLAMPGIAAHSPTNYINSIRLGKGL